MPADAETFLIELKSALLTFERAKAGEICDRLVAELEAGAVRFEPRQARRLLGELRQRRYFEEMERIAGAFARAGVRSLNVERQTAQALLDQGRLIEGVVLLTELIERAAGDPVEGPEARGLLGRAYKQTFVDHGAAGARPARAALRQAVEIYRGVYRSAPEKHLWHGINVVACAARAERDGVALTAAVDWRAMADGILAEIARRQRQGPLPAWDLATALEACVARDRIASALDWAEKYIRSYDADAFELASTLRQLTEIWQLDRRDTPASALLPILRGALLRLGRGGFGTGRAQGPAVELGTADLQRGGEAPRELQAKFGAESARSASWFKKAYRRTRSVARVHRAGGAHVGTGFLVRGSDLSHAWGDRPVLLTNAHVLAEPAPERGLGPRQARIRFTENQAVEDETFRVEKILFTSLPDALDTTVATLRGDARGVPELQLGSCDDLELDVEPRPRLSVIGHPAGRKLEISLYDNHLVDLDSPYVYYRSLTEGGSSGSPVFDQDWDVVALHHAANHRLRANEGVAIDAIREELKQRRSP